MLAREVEWTVIDFESTGHVKGLPNEPWQIGMVRVSGGAVVEGDEGCFETLLRTGDRPFHPQAPGRHDELREQIALSPTLHEIWPDIVRTWLARPLVAHNVGTEKSILRAAAPLHPFGPWVDTLRILRHAYPDMESHGLGEAIGILGLESRVGGLAPGRAAHDALFDAYACAVVLEHILSLPGWQDVSLRALETL